VLASNPSGRFALLLNCGVQSSPDRHADSKDAHPPKVQTAVNADTVIAFVEASGLCEPRRETRTARARTTWVRSG
jgi:hypothetical protein